ncbi:DUF1064 domain-containing protein [Halalkalibacter krulwichiae]|uniref:DUF1064 domain-containing protein n=1 Tax=Halalkalibacter krulwichiae TaxID=199441 RepID=A0A1X9M7Y4_9BACI|nr:DUF1064 domain-containing protein [Halalkalibacter krulwichiae]ARK28774.1 hypothetical protein BkAM31D_02305 [Halalkalibacter krulwichiae]
MARIRSKKVNYYGHTFDSVAEGEFYLSLRSDPNVQDIILQPQYTLIGAFAVPCGKCNGTGKVKSRKTANEVQCRSCKGAGESKRRPWTYKADFLVIYKDGRQEVIDVKGGFTDAKFPYVKKMFEYKTGQELIVWKKTRTGWKRG